MVREGTLKGHFGFMDLWNEQLNQSVHKHKISDVADAAESNSLLRSDTT